MMYTKLARIAICITGSISLFLIDHLLGNGFIKMLQKIACNVACFVTHSISETRRRLQQEKNETEDNITTYFVLSEILLISLIFLLIKKNKILRGHDRIDELLQESKDALQVTDEFLEKWRVRRIPMQNSYLDDEPQALQPIELEVPILHMAIVDTRCPVRSQPERGDACDSLEWGTSNIVSTVSLVEEELDIDVTEQSSAESRPWCPQQKYLWDVIEEDPSMEY